MSGTGLKGSGAGHWIWNLHILNKLHETSPITGILNDNLDYKHQKPILENSNKTTYLLTGFCLAHGLDLKKKVREWDEQRKLQAPQHTKFMAQHQPGYHGPSIATSKYHL